MRMSQKWSGLAKRASLVLASIAVAVATPAVAQVETIDPNEAIDADLMDPPPVNEAPQPDMVDEEFAEPVTETSDNTIDALPADPDNPDGPAAIGEEQEVADAESDGTYQKDDLIGAAEGVFGKGAKGLAGVIEDILKDQGEPNGYIVGREAGGALVVGLRYGSGKLYHKVEGERDVYWTGPSIGFDAGANAAKSFTLVYNLYDTEDLFKRYGTGEGAAYFVGGFNVSYLRRGDVVLIPVHLGAGVRLGANVGYRKFSKKQRWLPF
ncbi:MAG: DUF1134 domain-containing protein [Pseudomonadota bacterium]